MAIIPRVVDMKADLQILGDFLQPYHGSGTGNQNHKGNDKTDIKAGIAPFG